MTANVDFPEGIDGLEGRSIGSASGQAILAALLLDNKPSRVLAGTLPPDFLTTAWKVKADVATATISGAGAFFNVTFKTPYPRCLVAVAVGGGGNIGGGFVLASWSLNGFGVKGPVGTDTLCYIALGC